MVIFQPQTFVFRPFASVFEVVTAKVGGVAFFPVLDLVINVFFLGISQVFYVLVVEIAPELPFRLNFRCVKVLTLVFVTLRLLRLEKLFHIFEFLFFGLGEDVWVIDKFLIPTLFPIISRHISKTF